jgi:predicted amidohydrolase
MKIAVAQTKSIKGDISANMETHIKLIALSVSLKAEAIFFPELSLTGYEPQLSKELATNQDDKKLDDFQEISNNYKITIGIGMPTRADSGINISMIIFQPDAPRQTYSKQQLHEDEFPFFVNGEKQLILTVNNKKIAPAICFESLQAEHAEHASQLGAEIYLASVAKSQSGIDKAMIHYPEIAKKYAVPVLMSNCIGFCDNFQSAGKSAVWNTRGKLLSQLDDLTEGIILFDTESEEVDVHTI